MSIDQRFVVSSPVCSPGKTACFLNPTYQTVIIIKMMKMYNVSVLPNEKVW